MPRIEVVSNVLKANELIAEENRKRLENAGVFGINLMSSPGSGKTTLIEKTIPALAPLKTAVLVGDLQTQRDADRIGATGVQAVQINTGRGCHLTAEQVSAGLDRLDLSEIQLVIIENVGNTFKHLPFPG